MQKFIKWLRSLGWLGNLLGYLIFIATTNWVLVMSAIVGIWLGVSQWGVRFVHNANVQTVVIVFLVTLWTIIGLLVLRDRRKPIITQPYQDYRYGLTYEGCVPLYFPQKEELLQFGLQLRNYSSGPLRSQLENFQILIDDRILPYDKSTPLTTIMPRGGFRIFRTPPFKRSSLKDFFGQRKIGRADFSILYGDPEQPPIRRLKMTLELILEFKEDGSSLAYADNILEESDKPIGDQL
jgi:hypothetical protein